MKKIVNKIVLLLFLILVVTGCNSEKGNIKSSGNKNLNKVNQIGDYGYTNDIVCEAFEKGVKLINYNVDNNGPYWLITDDNSVYLYNMEQLFSETNSNCKKMDFKLPDYNLTIKYAYNYDFHNYNDYFYINKSNSSNELEFVYNEFDPDMPMIDSRVLRFRTPQEYNFSLMQCNSPGRDKNDCSYLGARNNKIYSFDILYHLSNHTWDLLDEEEIFSAPSDETILDFWLRDDIVTNENEAFYYDIFIKKGYVLTDKGYYRYMLKDETCYKYADVDCEYVLKKDEELSKYKDHILYRDESILITDSGRVYSLYGYGI